MRDAAITALRRKWDLRHAQHAEPPAAVRVLEENRHLLPATGEALDLACGLGGNALRLAEHGLRTAAWDLSSVAIDKLEHWAIERGLAIDTAVRDVIAEPPAQASFDVIVVSWFLDRSLAPALIDALRPGGLLFYQTFTAARVEAIGPDNPDFLLGEGELLTLFRPLRVRVYREEGRIGDIERGFRNAALLVAEKVMP